MMDKQSIVNTFLERGKLLTPEAVKFLETKNIDEILKNKYSELVLDVDTFMEAEKDRVKILKNFTEKPSEIKTQDFVNFYASKYEKMKKVIMDRIQKNFVSLNKVGARGEETYVIAMVRDIVDVGERKKVVVEDPTDSKSILFDAIDNINQDDVLVFRAISRGEILFGKGIMFPDIPLRSPTTGNGKACFISDLHLDEVPEQDAEKFFKWFELQKIKNLFVAGDIGDNKLFDKFVTEYCREKRVFVIPGNVDEREYPAQAERFKNENIVALSNPTMIELNGLKILMVHQGNVDMLRRRYLGKSRLILKEDYLVLEDVPDIMHYGHTHEPSVTNYKSVTLVNGGSLLTKFMPVIVDFASRETNQIDLEKERII